MARGAKGGIFRPTKGIFKGVPFRSYRQYRNALEEYRGGTTLAARQRRPARVLREHVGRLSPAERRAYERAWKAVEFKREDRHLSVEEAARRAGTTPNAIHRYVGAAWPSGYARWDVPVQNAGVDPADINRPGVLTLTVKNRRTASTLGRYLNAVSDALGGDDQPLTAFRGKSVTVDGVRYRLIDDPDLLREMFDHGELLIEYASGDVAA